MEHNPTNNIAGILEKYLESVPTLKEEISWTQAVQDGRKMLHIGIYLKYTVHRHPILFEICPSTGYGPYMSNQ